MKSLSLYLSLFLIISACHISENTDYSHWNTYGGTKDAARYSSLSEIDTLNVQNLEIAWTFKTGELDSTSKTQIQCNPIIIDSVMFGGTPQKNIFAINAATGRLIWLFKPSEHIIDETPYWAGTVRGVTYWQEKSEKIVFASVGAYLFALNPDTGLPIETFGHKGKIDLHDDLDVPNPERFFIVANTPGIVYKDKIIIGMRLSEDADAAPGHIRAYNVRTGKREWIFHTIPQIGEQGAETWKKPEDLKKASGANCWAGMSLDEKRGVVFVPTGTTNPDFYGGDRHGDNLFGNCIIAIDANTGKRIWHFQTVHHDLWDRDLPANPNLVKIKKEGKTIDAVAQITKQGFIFLLERETGLPIFPIEERTVPTTTELIGESPSPTQPYPTLPKPFARQHFSEKDINTLTTSPDEQKAILDRLKKLKKEHLYEPPSKQGTMIFPGFDGGGEWGGASFDPETGFLYVNANEMPWIMEMVDVPQPHTEGGTKIHVGETLYNQWCSSCHGKERKGNTDGTIPALTNVKAKYDIVKLVNIMRTGMRMMPAFPQISDAEKKAIGQYLLGEKTDNAIKLTEKPYSPYRMNGYNRFLTLSGHPAVSPPWGTLNAINLNTGQLVWKVPLGEFENLKRAGVPPTGTENYGGPVTTLGGLVFIAATKDEKIRAFNKKTGQLLWERALPAGGYATPSVYSVKGKQYVVIACGGGKMGTKSGDSYVAFALPQRKK